MDRINLYSVYELGYLLHPLSLWKESETKEGLDLKTYQLRLQLWKLYVGDPVELRNDSIITDVINAIEEALGEEPNDRKSNLEWRAEKIEAHTIKRIAKLVARLESVLYSDFPMIHSYAVQEVDLFSVDKLVLRPEGAFSKTFLELLKSMDRSPLSDFKEACQCLAFGFYTASGFHIVRSAESVLKHWCRAARKSDTSRMTWDQCVSALNGKYNKETNQEIKERAKATICVLQSFGQTNRNPLMHSEVTLDKESAPVLFGAVRSIISSMLQEVEIAKP